MCVVQPDPPVELNWTLLNVSLTSSYFDVLLNWMPPQSADVKMGWMTLQYEVQYRDNSTDKWTVVGVSSLKVSYGLRLHVVVVAATVKSCFSCPQLDLVKSTVCSLYGLQTNIFHEVRVRCKMLGGKELGKFSDSVFVHVPSKGKHLLLCLKATVERARSYLLDLGHLRT